MLLGLHHLLLPHNAVVLDRLLAQADVVLGDLEQLLLELWKLVLAEVTSASRQEVLANLRCREELLSYQASALEGQELAAIAPVGGLIPAGVLLYKLLQEISRQGENV